MSPSHPDSSSPRQKLLVLEFWGLGDLTFSTALLREAANRFDVTLAGKPHARVLLEPSFPALTYLGYDAPWSAYHGKYALWRWNWPELVGLIRHLRQLRFDAAVSVRNDPRDHLLMWLIGTRRRVGFPRRGSQLFLTDALQRNGRKQHKVEDWRDIGVALGLPNMQSSGPKLDHAKYRTALGDRVFSTITKPVICLHPGARIPVRRWPEANFAKIIAGLRQAFDFHFLLIPDPDGYGGGLAPMADTVLRPLSVPELVDVLGRIDLLICNDSGPGHLAASCGRPVIPIFGPTDPDWFHPWGDSHHVVIRDICPLRPCFDYCAFAEPYCLTRLEPDDVWTEIVESIRTLIKHGNLPAQLLKSSPAKVAASIDSSPRIAVAAPVVAESPPLPASPAPTAQAHVDLTYSIADQNVATTKSIGIYNFSLQLRDRLAVDPRVRQLTVFTNSTIPVLKPCRPEIRVEEYNCAVQSRVGRIYWDQWGVYREAQKSGNPWLMLPKGFLSFTARPRVRVAAYVHDTMLDFYRRKYPEFRAKIEVNYFARSLAATIRNADVIFTNTEFSKGEIWDLARRLGLVVPKVVVAGYGFDTPELKSVQKENRVLLFASNMPHKRTDIAIRFLDHWVKESRFDGTIDCIGIIPPEMEKPAGKAWNWIGRVPPVQGREMIRNSRAVVYVSEHEGFGMPPVEAVMEGTCPIYSDIPPIREVMRDAGFAFSNESADSFANSMDQALGISSETIQTWCQSLMARHNWPGVTEKIVAELSMP